MAETLASEVGEVDSRGAPTTAPNIENDTASSSQKLGQDQTLKTIPEDVETIPPNYGAEASAGVLTLSHIYIYIYILICMQYI